MKDKLTTNDIAKLLIDLQNQVKNLCNKFDKTELSENKIQTNNNYRKQEKVIKIIIQQREPISTRAYVGRIPKRLLEN